MKKKGIKDKIRNLQSNEAFSSLDKTQIFLALSRADLPVKYSYMTDAGAQAWVALENNDDEGGEYIPHSVHSSQLLMKYKDIYLSDLAEGDDVIILDFGPGEGRPVKDFLTNMSTDRSVHYYGFDISQGVLDANKALVSEISENITYANIQVDFESGRFLEAIARVRAHHGGTPILALFLGSTIGNFASAERIVSNMTEGLGAKDKLVVDMQRSNASNPQWVSDLVTAYNDDVVKDFVFATLDEINFETSVIDWNADFDMQTQTIHVIATFIKDYELILGGQTLTFKKGQRIRLGKSAKFNEIQLATLAENLSLQINTLATSDDGSYLQMCISPRSSF